VRQEGGGEVCPALAAYVKPPPDELVSPEFARTESLTACWTVSHDMVAARAEQQYPESLDQHCPHVPRRVYPSRSWALAVKGDCGQEAVDGRGYVEKLGGVIVVRAPIGGRGLAAAGASGDLLRLRATFRVCVGSAVPAGPVAGDRPGGAQEASSVRR